MPRSVFAVYLLALLIGVVAGLRAMTAPAAVSWAARLGWLDLARHLAGVPRLRLDAVDLSRCSRSVELVTDQLPTTPSRTVPGAVRRAHRRRARSRGAAIGVARRSLVAGAVAGIVGAVIGTLGGRASRGAAGRGLRQRSSRRVHRGRGRHRRRAADRGRAAMTALRRHHHRRRARPGRRSPAA